MAKVLTEITIASEIWTFIGHSSTLQFIDAHLSVSTAVIMIK